VSERKSIKRIILQGQNPGSARVPTDTNPGKPLCDLVYLLSPANSAGRHAKMLLNPYADFELAQRLRTTGISLGEAFSFMSSLYFRGKLAYATAFSQRTGAVPGTLIITSSRGLLRPQTIVRLSELEDTSRERIVAHNPKYSDPLERDLRLLSENMGAGCRAVLLGSIATKKYIPLLLAVLGDRLIVPRAFIGLGNMSRGALLLKCSRDKRELEYISAAQVLSQMS